MVLVLLVAGTLAYADCWTDYRTARDAAKAQEVAGDYVTASNTWLAVEKAALALVSLDGTAYGNAQGIADWDLNNAGYMLILDFKLTKNPDDLRQALVILKSREVNSDAKEKVEKNINYCETTLKDNFKSVDVKASK
jgi:hypothetical protein